LRTGFTLVEVVLSAVTLAVLLLATGSAVALAARAIPDGRSVASATVAGGRALDSLTTDLADATAVTSATATAITLTVPDRTGDGVADTITYAWSGVSDAPLTRKFNTGTAATIAAKVREFKLTLDIRSSGGPNRVTGVRVALRVGSDARARLNTDARTFNEPTGP
jgi:hypothetical protein